MNTPFYFNDILWVFEVSNAPSSEQKNNGNSDMLSYRSLIYLFSKYDQNMVNAVNFFQNNVENSNMKSV